MKFMGEGDEAIKARHISTMTKTCSLDNGDHERELVLGSPAVDSISTCFATTVGSWTGIVLRIELLTTSKGAWCGGGLVMGGRPGGDSSSWVEIF